MKPKFKNYDKKYSWLWMFHGGSEYKPAICTGCGEELKDSGYYELTVSDIAHNFPRTEKNINNYPLFIDSLLNISLQHRECNVNRKQPIFEKNDKFYKLLNGFDNTRYSDEDAEIDLIFMNNHKEGFNYFHAGLFEKYLEENPEFDKFVNMEE